MNGRHGRDQTHADCGVSTGASWLSKKTENGRKGWNASFDGSSLKQTETRVSPGFPDRRQSSF